MRKVLMDSIESLKERTTDPIMKGYYQLGEAVVTTAAKDLYEAKQKLPIIKEKFAKEKDKEKIGKLLKERQDTLKTINDCETFFADYNYVEMLYGSSTYRLYKWLKENHLYEG